MMNWGENCKFVEQTTMIQLIHCFLWKTTLQEGRNIDGAGFESTAFEMQKRE